MLSVFVRCLDIFCIFCSNFIFALFDHVFTKVFADGSQIYLYLCSNFVFALFDQIFAERSQIYLAAPDCESGKFSCGAYKWNSTYCIPPNYRWVLLIPPNYWLVGYSTYHFDETSKLSSNCDNTIGMRIICRNNRYELHI